MGSVAEPHRDGGEIGTDGQPSAARGPRRRGGSRSTSAPLADEGGRIGQRLVAHGRRAELRAGREQPETAGQRREVTARAGVERPLVVGRELERLGRRAAAHLGEPSAPKAGTITARWSRSGSRARVDTSRAIGAEPGAFGSCSTCAPTAPRADGWSASTAGATSTLEPCRTISSVVPTSRATHGAQRAALRQLAHVAPGQVGSGELGVDRLVDLGVPGTPRRVGAHDRTGVEPGDVAGADEVVAERAGRAVGGVGGVLGRERHGGLEPAVGQLRARHQARGGRSPPAEELHGDGHGPTSSTMASATCWTATEPPLTPPARVCASTAETSSPGASPPIENRSSRTTNRPGPDGAGPTPPPSRAATRSSTPDREGHDAA